MKKLFYFAAAAVALAACAKNEVIPVNSGENQEITFNVAPKTKAADLDGKGHKEFATNHVFASWAYYLPEGKTWNANYAVYESKRGDQNWKPEEDKDYTVPQEYISGAKISNNERTGNKWKCEGKSYYWPKDGGSLTFFAYSLNKGDLTLTEGTGFTCTHENGIAGHIDLNVNHNTDFLVAEIAKDKTSNGKEHFTNGVPTLFKHKLSSVAFAIKTGAAYADKSFKLTSITIKNISHYGTYGQLPTESFSASGTSYSPVFTSTAQDITYQTDFVPVTGKDKYIFIPQTFAQGSDAKKNAYIEVEYTITTSKTITNTEGQEVKQDIVTENVTKQIFLNPENGKGTKMFDKWEMGKKYTINLTFTLDEILWDPAVQDWEDVNIGTDAKPIIVG